MKAVLIALACAMGMATPASAATLFYSFTTEESFVGGTVSFALQADAPLPDGRFIEASALSSFSPGVARVRFVDTCFVVPSGASVSAPCDIVEVIVDRSVGGLSVSTSVTRLVRDGGLVAPGVYANLAGPAATLTVTAAPGAVPEPATWAMLLAGFALLGTSLRRRSRQSSPGVRIASARV